jgi:hypothetical protein
MQTTQAKTNETEMTSLARLKFYSLVQTIVSPISEKDVPENIFFCALE